MIDLALHHPQVRCVQSFHELVSTPLHGDKNAICWSRQLVGDFSEIINKVAFEGNMTTLDEESLMALSLSKQGTLAREILIHDLNLLKSIGAAPVLNIIKSYDRDDSTSFFPTDVYSFHVDQAPVPVDTFLCTYYGNASEILPNEQGIQKILVPEIRSQLKEIYGGSEYGFESFLSDYFYDLHYQAKSDAQPFSLGKGHLWKIATAYPNSAVMPCIHRAPIEGENQKRLLIIC
ncbi:MAG: hypothetical protein R3279_09935 [Putridiphycobacter sp.]|nr:hypothetical protein [Putridiphycobacter sp.]